MNKEENYKALALQSAADYLQPALLGLVKSSGVFDTCYAQKIRIKKEAKLLEKKNLKKIENPDYELSNITDVVGLRLVALFRKDMVDLLDGCLKTISHNINVSPNIFCKESLEEIIFYKGNSAFDELSPLIRSVVEKNFNGNVTFKEVNSRERYSSIHLVARLNSVGNSDPSLQLKELFGNEYLIPIEIQIRTVFEDAWGEIDHKYGYTIRTGKNSGSPVNNPENILSHLKILKQFTDASMEYAEEIRREASKKPEPQSMPTSIVSVDLGNLIITRFRELGVDDDRVNRYIAASDMKESVFGDESNKVVIAPLECVKVAEAFRNVTIGVDENYIKHKGTQGEKLIFYYSKMDEAFCMMSMRDANYINIALQIYKMLDQMYSGYPLLTMRMGQALGKLGNHEDAIACLKKALNLTKEIYKTIDQKRTAWPDALPRADYSHIVSRIPKLIGFYLWGHIETIEPANKSEIATLYYRAYQETLVGLEGVKSDKAQFASYRNNLLFYAIGYLKNLEHENPQLPWSIESAVMAAKEGLAYFEQQSDSKIEIRVQLLDTLMQTYVYFGDLQNARKIAQSLKMKALEPKAMISSELALRFIRDAERVMLKEVLEIR